MNLDRMKYRYSHSSFLGLLSKRSGMADTCSSILTFSFSAVDSLSGNSEAI